MSKKEQVGLFEASYHIIGEYLLKHQNAERIETKPLKKTCLTDVVKANHDKVDLGISNPELFLVDPVKFNLVDCCIDWGMLAYSPDKKNIIGSIFHLPFEQTGNLVEISCGLILEPYSIALVYGNLNPYNMACVELPFTYEPIETELEYLKTQEPWDQLSTNIPEIYDFMGILVTITHDLLTSFQDDDL